MAASGVNWGFLQVDTAKGSVSMRDPAAAPTAAPYVTIPKALIADVTNTRTDLIITATANNADGLREIKFTVPKDSHGFEKIADPCKHLRDQLTSAAGVKDAAEAPAGDLIGVFENVALQQPSGTFTISVYMQALQLKDNKSGAVYRTAISNVARLFMLPVPLQEANFLVVVLKQPLRVGSVLHTCLVFNIPSDLAIAESNPWRPSGIKTEADLRRLFPEKEKCLIKLEMSGPVCQVLASVLKTVTQVPLTGANDDFKNAELGTCAVRAQLKGSSGWLFALKHVLLFLHRPATLLPYAGMQITQAEVFATTATLTLEVPRDGAGDKNEKVMLGGIASKPDFANLMAYLESRGVKANKPEADDDEEDGEEGEDESFAGSNDDDDDTGSDFDEDSEGSERAKKRHRTEGDKKPKKEKKEKKAKKEKKDKKDKKEKKEKKEKH
jgi:hypothetical protein